MICPSCNAPNRDDAKFCKSCGASFPKIPMASNQTGSESQSTGASPASSVVAIANQAPAPIEVHQGEEDSRDLASEPTLILTPEQKMAYISRRWQQEEEHHTAVSTPASAPAPQEQVQDEADIPTVLMSPPSSDNEATAIPPPPPPVETDATKATYGGSSINRDATVEGRFIEPSPQGTATNASAHAQDMVATAATTEETNAVTQTSSDQPNQTTSADDFSPLAVGATVAGRYEVSQVVSTSEAEHLYLVIDHQGYQRCWSCSSEQNAQDDEFCTNCGARLLDVSYTMHEYSPSSSTTTDAHVLHGTIVNTFVEQGRTYMIEQPQVTQNAFPNGVHLQAASHSDAGDVRRSEPNEDSTLVLMLQRIHESKTEPHGVFIVADGLGGHDNGQVASRMTISIIAERMVRELLAEPLLAENGREAAKSLDEDELVALLRGAVEDANAALCQKNERDDTDMGSTITGFMVVGDHAYILNVGDSRTYMLRGEQLYKLTNDHSLVAQLVAGGLIEPDDVYTHPQRSQIFRSLGDKLNVQIDIFKQQLLPGDIMLSCSDGLWEMVRDPQMESILNAASDPQTACYQLIEAANANGGEDNVSAVVVFAR